MILQCNSIFLRGCLFACLSAVAILSHGEEIVRKKTPEPADTALLDGPRALSRAFRAAARKATPAVVTIYSFGQNLPPGPNPTGPTRPDGNARPDDSTKPESFGRLGDPSDGLLMTGIGSGVIISADGLVITNNHVINGAKKVVVHFTDDTKIDATDVQGDSDSDIATLRIKRDEPFQFAEIGNSDNLEIGDWVLSIGSPFAFEATVSAGIISAKNRTLPNINRVRLFQTDAAINPGNSGGPLIDLDGNVIAINTAIATRSGVNQGIGFAIPIKQAKWIADELANHGVVRRAAIGITMAELKPKIATMFKLPVGIGVLAYEVIEGSTASRAGIKPIDVIVEFAGERVRDPRTLREAIERQPVGSFQKMKVLRDGEEIELKVELATLEDPTKTKAVQNETAPATPTDPENE